MNEWRATTWGSVIELQRGFDITKSEQCLTGEVPVVSSGGVSSYHDKSMAEGPGVVIGRKGTLGRVHFVEEDYWPHDTTLWVKDFKGNDERFVYYSLQQLDTDHFNVGSASPTLNRNHVYPLPVRWPENVGLQRAIAAVLGALDEKIAANEMVIGSAESLADALFRQSASGISPGPFIFQDIAAIEGGGTPKTKVEEYWGDEIAWATPTDVTQLNGLFLDDTSRKLTETGLDACSSQLHPVGSILMTSRATIGALAVAAIPMAVNQGFIVANATEPDGQWWLYHEMKSRVPDFLNFANGATFMELPRGKFKQIPVRWPCEEILSSFNALVSEIHGKSRVASVENVVLARTRDELLPLLMSGKIAVKDAEALVSDAV